MPGSATLFEIDLPLNLGFTDWARIIGLQFSEVLLQSWDVNLRFPALCACVLEIWTQNLVLVWGAFCCLSHVPLESKFIKKRFWNRLEHRNYTVKKRSVSGKKKMHPSGHLDCFSKSLKYFSSSKICNFRAFQVTLQRVAKKVSPSFYFPSFLWLLEILFILKKLVQTMSLKNLCPRPKSTNRIKRGSVCCVHFCLSNVFANCWWKLELSWDLQTPCLTLRMLSFSPVKPSLEVAVTISASVILITNVMPSDFKRSFKLGTGHFPTVQFSAQFLSRIENHSPGVKQLCAGPSGPIGRS